MRSLVWFRGKDLRTADHGPLVEAVTSGEVIPLFVLDPYFFSPERARTLAPRMQVLLEALNELERTIASLGSRLLLVSGRSVDVVPRCAERWKVDQVLAHRWSEPFGRERDARIGRDLEGRGIAFRLFEGETLVPPGTLRASNGRPFTVFTAFARAFQREGMVGAPLECPRHLPPLPKGLGGESVSIPSLGELGFVRNEGICSGGETCGLKRMETFMLKGLHEYQENRNRMDREGTSRLSMDLHFGTLSVRTLWRRISEQVPDDSTRAFHNELLWREFAHHWLWERPDLLLKPFRAPFEGFPWREDEDHWQAWSEGLTGYPVVDAAARQLLAEGFVHNRARMVAASFLAKHLLQDFRRGESHYLAHLADADLANNDLGWQWSAGCGCDAQPWFRVFNPVLQGERFDPEGDYVRRWVPELASLPARWIHKPHLAPTAMPGDYPHPIVNHAQARNRFLQSRRIGQTTGAGRCPGSDPRDWKPSGTDPRK
jgi:deoxyribodipyrimidine photo-lyase